MILAIRWQQSPLIPPEGEIEALCAWCHTPIDPQTWTGWEVFADANVAGPCCNTCATES